MIFHVNLNFHMICCSFVNNFKSSLKDSHNFFIQSLPLYTSCLFSMLLNEDIVDTEKPDAICLDGALSDIWYWLYFSVFKRRYNITKIFIFSIVN